MPFTSSFRNSHGFFLPPFFSLNAALPGLLFFFPLLTPGSKAPCQNGHLFSFQIRKNASQSLPAESCGYDKSNPLQMLLRLGTPAASQFGPSYSHRAIYDLCPPQSVVKLATSPFPYPFL